MLVCGVYMNQGPARYNPREVHALAGYVKSGMSHIVSRGRIDSHCVHRETMTTVAMERGKSCVLDVSVMFCSSNLIVSLA